MGERLRVLLVEDDDGQAELVAKGLAAASVAETAFAVERVARLDEAVERLRQDGAHVLVLDLDLPDSTGLETLARVRAAAPGVPVVVLGGSHEATRGAVEAALGVGPTARERRQQELLDVARLAEPTERTAEVTARSFGVQRLSQALPEQFGALVERYAGYLDRALEQRAYRVESARADDLRALAGELGFLRAGPRDVVELHTTALRSRIDGATPRRAQAYVEEARLVVLEVMGYLVETYRR